MATVENDVGTRDLTEVSLPSRVAADGEGIGPDELGLAARNHGMPLEALRYDVTPLGLHYLLTHYDIPDVDPSTYRLSIGGLVESPLTLSLDELRARPRVSAAVTLECAGNGRARLLPRPVSQPWLHEAVGTMRWTGTPLAPLLREAGLSDRAVDVVFTGVDHGVERGEEQDYARGLPLAEALRDEVLLAYECNDVPLLPQHGFPLRLVVPGWYGMAHVKWLRSIEVVDTPFDGYQQRAYSLRQETGEPGTPADPHRPARPDGAARLPRLHVAHPHPRRRGARAARSGLVRLGTGGPGRGQHRRRRDVVAGRARAAGGRVGLATVDLHLARGDPRPVRRVGPGERRHRSNPAERAALEPRWVQQHVAAAGRRRRDLVVV